MGSPGVGAGAGGGPGAGDGVGAGGGAGTGVGAGAFSAQLLRINPHTTIISKGIKNNLLIFTVCPSFFIDLTTDFLYSNYIRPSFADNLR